MELIETYLSGSFSVFVITVYTFVNLYTFAYIFNMNNLKITGKAGGDLVSSVSNYKEIIILNVKA